MGNIRKTKVLIKALNALTKKEKDDIEKLTSSLLSVQNSVKSKLDIQEHEGMENEK